MSPTEDQYTGRVAPGGPASIRSLIHLDIGKLSVGPMDNNCYLLRCRATGEALLIDAAAQPERIFSELVRRENEVIPTVRTIVTTHRHADHWQALADVVAATNATVAAGREDAADLPVQVDVPLDHGDVLRFGDIIVGVVALRGHTPGSVAVRYDDPAGVTHLFTGDSLFPGGPGKTMSAQDFASLMDDLEERVFAEFADDTWVYPGHGDDTTLGAERPQLPAWRARGW